MSGSISEEQRFIDSVMIQLHEHIQHLEQRISETIQQPSTGTQQDELEREALLENLYQQLRAANASRNRLCVGRIKYTSGEDYHIGRIGLRDNQGETTVIDWRAPQAEPFYRATNKEPLGLALRRRISTRPTPQGTDVTHVDDEFFDGSSLDNAPASRSLDTPRDGRMADILATIAADQDRIIRSPIDQVTVVDGGPGTGKTVVALHRAAWLLYTHRRRLSKDGVLVVGPSNVFLQYIEQVLPSLGETDVVMLTPSEFYPHLHPSVEECEIGSRVKGDSRMAKVLRAAVASRVRIPDNGLHVTTSSGTDVRVTASQLRKASRGLLGSQTFHAAREQFLRRALSFASFNAAVDAGRDVDDADFEADFVASIVQDPNVKREFNLVWLPTSPEKIVSQLLTNPDHLANQAQGILSASEQEAISRSASDPWTLDDVPLLDETSHLLGPWDPTTPRGSEDPDYRGLQASDAYRVPVETPSHTPRAVAESAYGSSDWIYGHVIVDEAQELSAMAWRCIARRSTRRSMTIVGDVNQASHPAAVSSWSDALSWAGDRVVHHKLDVTYRITHEIAEAATELLVRHGGTAPVLTPIRNGRAVTKTRLSDQELAKYARSFAHPDGRSAIIIPDTMLSRARKLFSESIFGFDATALDSPIAVLRVGQSKGLEFDCVMVVDPTAIGEQRPRGADIYIAATRATQDLHLIDLYRPEERAL